MISHEKVSNLKIQFPEKKVKKKNFFPSLVFGFPQCIWTEEENEEKKEGKNF